MIPYLRILLTSTLSGAGIGFLGGLSLGWYWGLSYHRQGPSDPGDAPAYVTMGLLLIGASFGAVFGLVLGIILCVRVARRTRRVSGIATYR